MKLTNVVLGVLAAGALALAGCGKSAADNPPGIVLNGVNVDTPKLQAALATAKPDVLNNLPKVSFGMRYGDYPGALAALQKIADDPSLTDAQKKLANQVLEQLKQAIAKAPPKQ